MGDHPGRDGDGVELLLAAGCGPTPQFGGPRRVPQQVDDLGGQVVWVAGAVQQPVDPVTDDLGDAADPAATTGQPIAAASSTVPGKFSYASRRP